MNLNSRFKIKFHMVKQFQCGFDHITFHITENNLPEEETELVFVFPNLTLIIQCQ